MTLNIDVAEVESFDSLPKSPTVADVDAEFWKSRESLTAIRDYALACMVSPWGFLGAVIAYTVAAVPYWCALPGIADDDEPGSLNLFVGLVARSGGSKGRIVKAARRYVGRADLDLPPGSGCLLYTSPSPRD